MTCGNIRPRDGHTRCNQEEGHGGHHMDLGPPREDHDGSFYRTSCATWDSRGVETCDGCGHRIDNDTGLCTAPLSNAD